jgi:hypothetical protein
VRRNDYSHWNQILAEHCLLSADEEERACLAVSPNILAAAWAEHQQEFLLPEEAEERFVKAVSDVYRREVIPAGLHVLNRMGNDGLPQSIAFLGLSVLAAYKMHRDEENGYAAHAYYPRLGELMGCELDNNLPRGFKPHEFKRLWTQLREWLKDERNISLAHPKRNFGARHIVELPLSHVPLRQIDLEKLPNFFSSCQYQPGLRTAKHNLARKFLRWAGAGRLTLSGMAALNDTRRDAVLAQVAQELEAWDGLAVDASGTNFAPVELQLDFVLRRPQLSYLPRRPRLFPAVFNAGGRVFESSDEGWYDPTIVPRDDGPALAQGFAWNTVYNGRRLTLHRAESNAIALAPAPYQASFVSRPRLLLNVKCAVLCRDELAGEVATYLSSITDRRCTPTNHQTLPLGWSLFLDVQPLRQSPSVPPQLEYIDVETETSIVPTGGLRVSRRQWLVGAPPRIFISGVRAEHGRSTVDGDIVDIDADGQLIDNNRLAALGTHLITAGRARLNIEIINPDVPIPDADGGERSRHQGTFVALPAGRWTLIGASCHEVMHLSRQSNNGVIARTPFSAVWAVNRDATAEVKVVCLAVPPRLPVKLAVGTNITRQHIAEQWVAAVYSSNSLYPRIGCLMNASEVQVIKAWRAYAATAHSLRCLLQIARRRYG